jgi:hypothetical protein
MSQGNVVTLSINSFLSLLPVHSSWTVSWMSPESANAAAALSRTPPEVWEETRVTSAADGKPIFDTVHEKLTLVPTTAFVIVSHDLTEHHLSKHLIMRDAIKHLAECFYQ